jgi:hypothetical protein
MIGCALVALVLLVGAVALGIRLFRDAVGPEITATQVPEVLPEGVPLHPGLALDEARTRGLQLEAAELRQSLQEEAPAADVRMLYFRSEASYEEVALWYMEQLLPADWLLMPAEMEDPSSVGFSRDETHLVLQQSADGAGAVVATVIRNLPGFDAPYGDIGPPLEEAPDEEVDTGVHEA